MTAQEPLDPPAPPGVGEAPSRHRLDLTSRWRLLLGFPAACAVFNIGVQLYLSSYGMFDASYGEDLSAWDVLEALGLSVFGLVLIAYNLLAPFALAVLIVVGQRRLPQAMAVVTAACVAFTAASFWLLHSMLIDESSTAVLLLVFLPIYLVLLLIPFVLVAVLVHRLRTRTSRLRRG